MSKIRFISKYVLFNGDVSEWYLKGGINPANCIVAYQPKGAASYAASKINLANPGTYDAFEGNAVPWDAVNGWKFQSPDHLRTGFTPASGWSVLCQYTNVTTINYMFGMFDGTNYFMIQPNRGPLTTVWYWNGTAQSNKTPEHLNGNLGIAGQKAYRDGVDEGLSLAVWGVGAGVEMILGGYNNNGTPPAPTGYCNHYMTAISFYDTVLTDGQMLAIATAMAAL